LTAIVAPAVGAYLVGCVPTARLVSRLAGERAWTPWAGALADALKGFLAVGLLSPATSLGPALAATAVIAGHQWPIAGRTGERGLATAAGALTAITPIGVPLWGVIWAVVFVASGYNSLAVALASLLVVPAIGLVAGWPLALLALPLAAMVLERMRAALRRCLLGTEQKYLWRGGE
jgi:glycerol-3-phosphate acyltransferase PlsY